MNLFASLNDFLSRLREGNAQAAAAQQNHSWSISARLAATPEADLTDLPGELAALIQEAKSLHPEMASASTLRKGARLASTQGE